jgi:hypothetical protein
VRALPPSLAGRVGHGRPWPKRMVHLATDVLPRGPVRERYRAELLAELDPLSPRAQFRFAAGAIASALALRRAVSTTTPELLEATVTVPRKPLTCRLNLHHRWEAASTSDGQRFVRCARCHKERGDGRTGMSGTAMGAGGVG